MTKDQKKFDAIIAKNEIAKIIKELQGRTLKQMREPIHFDALWFNLKEIEAFIGCGNQPSVVDFIGDKNTSEIKKRLEYLRGELRAERMSYGELAELQSLKEYIEDGDVELLEAAGVPEFEN